MLRDSKSGRSATSISCGLEVLPDSLIDIYFGVTTFCSPEAIGHVVVEGNNRCLITASALSRGCTVISIEDCSIYDSLAVAF